MRALVSLALLAALAAPLASAQDLLWTTGFASGSVVETSADGTVTVGGNPAGPTVARFAADGSLLWSTPLPSLLRDDALVDLTVGPGGEVYALTQYNGGSDEKTNIGVYRIDADGSVAWSHGYDGPNGGDQFREFDSPRQIVVTSTGVVVTVAQTGFHIQPGNALWVQGHAADGTLLWTQTYGAQAGVDYPNATRAVADCDGNVVIVGNFNRSTNTPNVPGFVLSYASDGSFGGAASMLGPTVEVGVNEASHLYLNDVAADCATGAVYVAGNQDTVTRANGQRRDAFVARFDGTASGPTWKTLPYTDQSGRGNSSTSGLHEVAVGASDEIYASAEVGESASSTDRVEVVRLDAGGEVTWNLPRTGVTFRRALRSPLTATIAGVVVATSGDAYRYEGIDSDGVLDWFVDRSFDESGGIANRPKSMAAHPAGGVVWLEPYGAVLRVGPTVPTARIQLIHAAAALSILGPIEVYIDQPAESTTPDATFGFRSGSPVLTVPADSAFDVRFRFVTPPSGLPESLTFTAPGIAPGRYVVSLVGMFEAMVPLFASNPNGLSLLLRLRIALLNEVLGGLRHAGVPVVVTNAVTDAPEIDVVVAETGEVLADDLPYGEASVSAALLPGTHRIEVRRASDQSVIEAVLLTVGGDEESVALTVSGFLDPSANQNGPALTIAATDETGATDPGTVVTAAEDGPASGLALAGPNPTRSGGAVQFTVPAGHVRLTVVDLLGREVAILAEGARPAGTHAAALPTLAPGLYVLRLEGSGGAVSRRVAVVR